MVRAWDVYEGHRGRRYDISFVDACRSAFGGATVLSVGTTSLKGVSATVRVVSSTQGVETLSGTYQVSTDGGLTYSAPADVDGGATALETAIEQAIGRMADPTDSTDATVTDAGNLLRGCGYAYDVEYPAGRDFPPLQTNVSSFDSPELIESKYDYKARSTRSSRSTIAHQGVLPVLQPRDRGFGRWHLRKICPTKYWMVSSWRRHLKSDNDYRVTFTDTRVEA